MRATLKARRYPSAAAAARSARTSSMACSLARVSSSVQLHRPSSPADPAEAKVLSRFRPSSLLNFPSPSRNRPQDLSGFMKSNWTPYAWPRGSTTAARNS
jgi:hypothetical protein